MTRSDLLFDTWAWWEYLHASRTGVSLDARYVKHGSYRLHTSSISLGELAARLDADGAGDRITAACGSIRRMSHIWDVSADIAQEAGMVRKSLREVSDSANLADGIVLVTAKRAGARIVSADPAFRRVPGVISR